MHPVDAVTLEQAARILGVVRSTVQMWIIAGRLTSYGGRYEHRLLSQAEVEEVARETYTWRRRVPGSYWVAGNEAAAILGLSRQRLQQLAVQDRVPYVVHIDGIRLYRRAQLEVLARR